MYLHTIRRQGEELRQSGMGIHALYCMLLEGWLKGSARIGSMMPVVDSNGLDLRERFHRAKVAEFSALKLYLEKIMLRDANPRSNIKRVLSLTSIER
ncbi:MAG: hypothetical protein CML55_04265 [Rhodobacteraceae bacterium]|nr:hypothetical protein [Paracoccaceae bacterium]